MKELKPCPFCGEDGVLDERSSYTVECSVCGCCAWIPGRNYDGRPDWNTRPIEDALRAEVAALKAELERWKAPLTDEQADRFVYKWKMSGENLPGIDAAIRQVRADG